jgi:hypothetical protein
MRSECYKNYNNDNDSSKFFVNLAKGQKIIYLFKIRQLITEIA